MVMSDQKITEFRERALVAVTPPDPEELLERGRALHRRRRLVPAVAVAATAAVAFAVFTVRGGGHADSSPGPQVTPPPRRHPGHPVPELEAAAAGKHTAGGAADVRPGHAGPRQACRPSRGPRRR